MSIEVIFKVNKYLFYFNIETCKIFYNLIYKRRIPFYELIMIMKVFITFFLNTRYSNLFTNNMEGILFINFYRYKPFRDQYPVSFILNLFYIITIIID